MRKPRITLIGASVSAAIIILLMSAAVLKERVFLNRDRTFVMYFDGSARGLKKGAAVELRGVKVGEVTGVDLRYDPLTDCLTVPVLAEIDLKRITRTAKGPATRAFLMQQIGKGLKAQLQFEHFATGRLLVQLDFHPEEPLRLARSGLPYPEIPTIPSSMVELSAALQDMPLHELTPKAAEGIGKATKSPEIMKTIRSINLALDEARKLTVSIGESMGNAGARRSPVIDQLSRTLEKLSDAADSMRALSDYLNRHPDAFIRGKRASAEE